MRGIGAVLYQEIQGRRCIISYASATLTAAERRYHINEIECLAVVWAIRKYRALIEDVKFTLRTDSKILTWLERFRDSKAKLTRWSLLLSEYNFDVEHIPGSENELPDMLSRLPEEEEPKIDNQEERMLPPSFRPSQAVNVLRADQLMLRVKEGQHRSRIIRTDLRRWHHLAREGVRSAEEQLFFDQHVVDHDVLYKREGEEKLAITPKHLQRKIIYYHHDTDEIAHPGCEETLRRIKQRYTWRNIKKTVARYVKNCIICSTIKTRDRQAPAPMKAHRAEAAFETISVDLLGPYPETTTGKKYILLTGDVFSKWVEAKAVPDADATTLLMYLREEIVSRYGAPRNVITDPGGIFSSKLVQDYFRDHQIKHLRMAVEHPRANPVERRVQELKKCMRYFTRNKSPRSWEIQLPRALYVMRSRRNRATGETPAKIVLGYELPRIGEWQLPDYLRKRLNPSRPETEEIITRNFDYTKTYAPPAVAPAGVEPGDLVFVRRVGHPRNPFDPTWEGPYRVQERISTEVYNIKKGRRLVQTHIDCIRRCPKGNGDASATESEDEETEDSDSDSSGDEA